MLDAQLFAPPARPATDPGSTPPSNSGAMHPTTGLPSTWILHQALSGPPRAQPQQPRLRASQSLMMEAIHPTPGRGQATPSRRRRRAGWAAVPGVFRNALRNVPRWTFIN